MRNSVVMSVVCSVLMFGPAGADIPPAGGAGSGSATMVPAVLVAPVVREWQAQTAPRVWRPYGYGYRYADPSGNVPAYRTYRGWQSYGRSPGYVPYRPYFNRYATRPWVDRSYTWRSAPQYRWAGASRYRADVPRARVDRRDWRW